MTDIIESEVEEVPGPTVDTEKLTQWFNAKNKLAEVKALEMELRKELFADAFLDPTEGANNYDMGDGYTLRGQYKLDRQIDIGAFAALKETMREKAINPDKLVTFKPALSVKAYRVLDDDERAFFEQCLIIKPGTVSLSIVPTPKGKAKAKGL